MKPYLNVFLALTLCVVGCAKAPEFVKEDLKSPAMSGSGEPDLIFGDDGKLYHTWIAPHTDLGSALTYAAFDNGSWGHSHIISTGEDWFVNWADFPTMAIAANGEMISHWLQKSAPDTYAYDVRLSHSMHGHEWSPPITPHNDGTQTEHGFVSLLPLDEGRFSVTWLDGRETGGGHGHDDGHGGGGPMTLRTATWGPDGITNDTLLDPMVCDCCPTDAVRLNDKLVVVYRDRSEDEVRDIMMVTGSGDQWSEPKKIHDDNWIIAGCPVNGPAVDAQDGVLAFAWFTQGPDGEEAQVYITHSQDGGRQFGKAFRVDDGRPVGRVDIAYLRDGKGLVSWLELVEDGNQELRVRLFGTGGLIGESFTVGVMREGRSTGMPRMAVYKGDAYLTWTDPHQEQTVQLAKVSVTF